MSSVARAASWPPVWWSWTSIDSRFVENVAPTIERPFGRVALSRSNERRDLAGGGAGERVQPSRMIGELLPGDLGAPAPLRLHRLLPR